jgi:hypothetical protein
LALLNSMIDELPSDELVRDDFLCKTFDEHVLKIILRCDELIDISHVVKVKCKQLIQNGQYVIDKLEYKVIVHRQLSYGNRHSTTV